MIPKITHISTAALNRLNREGSIRIENAGIRLLAEKGFLLNEPWMTDYVPGGPKAHLVQKSPLGAPDDWRESSISRRWYSSELAKVVDLSTFKEPPQRAAIAFAAPRQRDAAAAAYVAPKIEERSA